MSGFLLDTNVISEFARPDNKPDPQEKRQPQICADERRHKSAANGREIREFGLYQGTTLVVLQARNRFPSLLSGMDLWPTKGDENRRLPMSCFQSVTLCFRPCRRPGVHPARRGERHDESDSFLIAFAPWTARRSSFFKVPAKAFVKGAPLRYAHAYGSKVRNLSFVNPALSKSAVLRPADLHGLG